MDDEDIFRRAMESLGVRPLDRRPGAEPSRPGAEPSRSGAEPSRPGAEPSRSGRPETDPPDEEDALFLAAMKDLGPPDKDSASASPRRRVSRRLKVSQSRGARPQATVDLHGSTAEEALRKLERFVAHSAAERLKTVCVVTGKGLRSAGGVAVLKETVERWLRSDGSRRVAAYSEAPRELGGRGAYILYLR